MLSTIDRQLRRHRQQALTALVVLAFALATLAAHTALMSSGADDRMMGNAAAACLAVGGLLAIAGGTVGMARRLQRLPLWRIPAPVAPALPVVSPSGGFRARAGPSPPLLQVFRQ